MIYEKSKSGEKIRVSVPLEVFEREDLIQGGKLAGCRHCLRDRKNPTERLFFPDYYLSDLSPMLCVKIVNLYVDLESMRLVAEYKELAGVKTTHNKLFGNLVLKATLQMFQRDFLK